MEKKLYEIEDLNCENDIGSDEDLALDEFEGKGKESDKISWSQKKKRTKITQKKAKKRIRTNKEFQLK